MSEPQTTWHQGDEPPKNGEVVLGFCPGLAMGYAAVFHDGNYWRKSRGSSTTVKVVLWMNIPSVYAES